MAMTDIGLFNGPADPCPMEPQSSITGSQTLFNRTVSLPAIACAEAAILENAAYAWAHLADEALQRGDQDTAIDMITWAYRAADCRKSRA